MLTNFFRLNECNTVKLFRCSTEFVKHFENSNSLRHAVIQGGSRIHEGFKDLEFENVNLSKITFERVTFTRCVFRDCLFVGTRFVNQSFIIVSFKTVTLINSY